MKSLIFKYPLFQIQMTLIKKQTDYKKQNKQKLLYLILNQIYNQINMLYMLN